MGLFFSYGQPSLPFVLKIGFFRYFYYTPSVSTILFNLDQSEVVERWIVSLLEQTKSTTSQLYKENFFLTSLMITEPLVYLFINRQRPPLAAVAV